MDILKISKSMEVHEAWRYRKKPSRYFDDYEIMEV